jgi:hypothetical protein
VPQGGGRPVTVEWDRYQACPVCPALLGKPCLALSGWCGEAVAVEADRPHTGRKPRAGR